MWEVSTLPAAANAISIPPGSIWRNPKELTKCIAVACGLPDATRRTYSGLTENPWNKGVPFKELWDRWLSSARVEMLVNPNAQPAISCQQVMLSTLMGLPVTRGGRWDDVKSSCPYDLGYTRATMGGTEMRSWGGISKAIQLDCSLQLDCMKSESLVIVNQHVAVNAFLGLVHRPSHHESRQHLKPVTNQKWREPSKGLGGSRNKVSVPEGGWITSFLRSKEKRGQRGKGTWLLASDLRLPKLWSITLLLFVL